MENAGLPVAVVATGPVPAATLCRIVQAAVDLVSKIHVPPGLGCPACYQETNVPGNPGAR